MQVVGLWVVCNLLLISTNRLGLSQLLKFRFITVPLAMLEAAHSILLLLASRGGMIPEITMRYVSRYLSHDTIRITILH